MKFVYIAFLMYFSTKANCVKNNVCPTYMDYYTISDNANCWYDIAADSAYNVTDVIKSYGYPVEAYKVTTPDGYILSLFRIPNYHITDVNLRKVPVFLQHGAIASSVNFLARGKNSLAFVLADAGYDVWLGNYRGTKNSEGHVTLTVYDKQYWDHSADEIGLYDIPTMLELIVKKTGQSGNIVYIGHSLGTTVGMIYGSTFPEQTRQTVKIFILLAPAVSLKNMISPVRLAAPFADIILNLINNNDLIRLTSQAEPLGKLIKPICTASPNLMRLCVQIANLFYGPRNQMEAYTVPVFFNQYPGGTSTKVVKHVADFILNPFRKYNFGLGNRKKYGTVLPPAYDVSKIEVPVFIMYAVNDWACTKKDSLILYDSLSPKSKIYGIHEITVPDFNHNDFLFGRDAKSLVYNKILNLLDQIN